MLQGKWFVTLTKSLENFQTYLEKTVRCVKSSNNIYTVSIGHNSQVFATPTLLRLTGHQLWEKLSCRNVFFSDTLPVMKNLVKRKHPSMVLLDGSTVKLNQQSIYQALFHEPFPAHDAMEDVRALRRIVFSKISAQPHTIVKQICFLDSNVLFLSFFSLSKN